MHLSITQKLFACFLALTIAILVATLGLARWSFERGFLDYVNTLERNRLERLAEDLVIRYESLGGSWDAFTDQDLQQIMAAHRPHGRRPSPKHSQDETRPTNSLKSDTEPGTKTRKRPRPPMALFTPTGQMIAGQPVPLDPDSYIRLPVLHNDIQIAELRGGIYRTVNSPEDAAFADNQSRQSAVIGFFALALAALVSFALSRALLKPIRASIASVARLSNGNYSATDTVPGDYRGNDELSRLASDLESLRLTLDATRNARGRLLADVSHELRTPVTILSGEIAALLAGIRPLDIGQVESLEEEVNRLKILIEDLNELALSDVGGLRYEYTSINLTDSLIKAVDSFSNRAKDADIDLTIAESQSVHVRGDAHRLHQLFCNLLNNSVRYTDSPGSIVVSISEQNARVHVVIEDTQPGVKDANHDRLFEALYREEQSRSRGHGGAGLGLAICQNIVKAHNGEISASSSSLGGLRIDVYMPTLNSERHE